jgi:hypothetical protein
VPNVVREVPSKTHAALILFACNARSILSQCIPHAKSRGEFPMIASRLLIPQIPRAARRALWISGAIVGSLVALEPAVAIAVESLAVSPGKAQRVVSLRDRLVVGLQARLKSEIAFVELVALRVRTGQLPQRLVDETFLWARQRAGSIRGGRARRPIIFFQPAMTARAKRLKVVL